MSHAVTFEVSRPCSLSMVALLSQGSVLMLMPGLQVSLSSPLPADRPLVMAFQLSRFTTMWRPAKGHLHALWKHLGPEDSMTQCTARAKDCCVIPISWLLQSSQGRQLVWRTHGHSNAMLLCSRWLHVAHKGCGRSLGCPTA